MRNTGTVRRTGSVRSVGVYAARIDFRIGKSHLPAQKSFPLFFNVCGEAVRVEK